MGNMLQVSPIAVSVPALFGLSFFDYGVATVGCTVLLAAGTIGLRANLDGVRRIRAWHSATQDLHEQRHTLAREITPSAAHRQLSLGQDIVQEITRHARNNLRTLEEGFPPQTLVPRRWMHMDIVLQMSGVAHMGPHKAAEIIAETLQPLATSTRLHPTSPWIGDLVLSILGCGMGSASACVASALFALSLPVAISLLCCAMISGGLAGRGYYHHLQKGFLDRHFFADRLSITIQDTDIPDWSTMPLLECERNHTRRRAFLSQVRFNQGHAFGALCCAAWNNLHGSVPASLEEFNS